jgi:copper(I)-binding protein
MQYVSGWMNNALRCLEQNSMRPLFKPALIAAVISVAPTQSLKTARLSTIAVELASARATPAGAGTGAVYMTLAAAKVV